MNPKVSILMPVYQGEKYVEEAIRSILNQTFKDFELLIIDDGSTDNSVDIIKKIAQEDNRISIKTHPKNQGLPYTRNALLDWAIGTYIAIFDCDDIAFPEKLEKQVHFLDNNLEIDVCGSWVTKIYEDKPTEYANYYPVKQQDFLFNFFFIKCILVNSSVMIRTKTLKITKIRYNDAYFVAEDVKLWFDLAQNNAKFYTLPESLLYFRIHKKEGASVSNKEVMNELLQKIVLNYLSNKLPELSIAEIEIFTGFCLDNFNYKVSMLKNVLKKIILLNIKHNMFERIKFEAEIDKLFFRFCAKNSELGFSVFYHYKTFKTKFKHKIGLQNNLNFLLDCLMKKKNTYYN